MIHDSLASAAFRYALRGVAVFPLAPGAKVPLRGSHGLKDASSDPDRTRERWRGKDRYCNISAATGKRSGFWVLDVDLPEGDKSIAELEAEHGPLPPTIEARTPSGGRHLFWKWQPDGPEIRCSTGRLGPCLDVKAEGGSIILPPSVLVDSRCYAWVKNGVRTFAPAPDWLTKLALPPPLLSRPKPKPLNRDVSRYVATAAASELTALERATEGTRNAVLNRAAFNLAGFVLAGALPESWTKEHLEARAVGTGLPLIEARRTIESAFKAAKPRELPR